MKKIIVLLISCFGLGACATESFVCNPSWMCKQEFAEKHTTTFKIDNDRFSSGNNEIVKERNKYYDLISKLRDKYSNSHIYMDVESSVDDWNKTRNIKFTLTQYIDIDIEKNNYMQVSWNDLKLTEQLKQMAIGDKKVFAKLSLSIDDKSVNKIKMPNGQIKSVIYPNNTSTYKTNPKGVYIVPLLYPRELFFVCMKTKKQESDCFWADKNYNNQESRVIYMGFKVEGTQALETQIAEDSDNQWKLFRQRMRVAKKHCPQLIQQVEYMQYYPYAFDINTKKKIQDDYMKYSCARYAVEVARGYTY